MMRSKASKDSSRGFQVSSEISFLISVRKVLPTSDQIVDLTTKIFLVWELNAPSVSAERARPILLGHSLQMGPASITERRSGA